MFFYKLTIKIKIKTRIISVNVLKWEIFILIDDIGFQNEEPLLTSTLSKSTVDLEPSVNVPFVIEFWYNLTILISYIIKLYLG